MAARGLNGEAGRLPRTIAVQSAQMFACLIRRPRYLANPTRRMTCASRQNRDAKPMELPPNLEAVYLGEIKRALALGVLPTTDPGVLAVTAKKQFRKSR